MRIDFSNFGSSGFSFRGFAIVSAVASLFSWFVLNHTNATVFFALAAGLSLLVVAMNSKLDQRFEDVYSRIDDEGRTDRNEIRDVYSAMDRLETRIDMLDNKSNRR